MHIEERIPEEEDLNKAIGYLVVKNMNLVEEVEQLRGSLAYWQQKCSEAEDKLYGREKRVDKASEMLRSFEELHIAEGVSNDA